MAVTSVSLGPALQAWALAGVTHILCDEAVGSVFPGEGAFGQSDIESRLSTREPLPPRLPPHQDGQVRGEAARIAERFAPPAAAAPRAAGAPGGEDVSRGTAQPAGEGRPLLFAPRDGVAADPATWPEPWAGWFAKIVPAPVLWTYHELGADLTGIGRSPERSHFFKQLIGELRLPKGSSVFWPCAMPAMDETEELSLRSDAAIFSSGLARLMPHVVVVFGKTALADIGLAGKIQPLRQAMVEGKLVVCFPEINVLLHDQGQRSAAVSLIRAVLGSVSLADPSRMESVWKFF